MKNTLQTCPKCSNRGYRQRACCHYCAPFNRKWTDKEDDTVKSVYPSKGADAVLLLLPYRTRNTIINRAIRSIEKMSNKETDKEKLVLSGVSIAVAHSAQVLEEHWGFTVSDRKLFAKLVTEHILETLENYEQEQPR